MLTEPGLSVIIDAMVLSRKIFQRVRNYCIFRIAGTIQLILFFFMAIFVHPNRYFTDSYDKGSTQDHLYLPVIAIVLITLLNDACVLTIARDNVVANRHPQDWNLVEVFIVSAVLGIIACAGSFLLLEIGLHASNEDPDGTFACTFFKPMGNSECVLPKTAGADLVLALEGETCDNDAAEKACLAVHGAKCEKNCEINYEQLLSVLYLKLALTDFITVFAARTRGMFWTRMPGQALLGAFVVATGASTFISCVARWPGMQPIDPGVAGMVWVYAIVWFLIQDVAKTACYWVLGSFHAPTKKSTEADHPMSPTIVRKNRNQTFSTADFLEYQSRRGQLRHSASVPSMMRYGREHSYGRIVRRRRSAT